MMLAVTRGRGLWASSSLTMLALHAGALAAAVLWQMGHEPATPPPGAMLIELAPPPETPPAAKPEPPRPPEPEKKVERPRPEPVKKPQPVKPKAPPVPQAAVADPTQAAEVTPPAAPPEPAAAPAAAAPLPSPSVSNAVPNWQGTLRAHLERHKRYPSAAQFRRQQGAPMVRFVMDRQGNVLSAHLERSSGHSTLDEEAVALLARAQPLPQPPPEVTGDRIELRVPIQFFLR